MLAAPKVRRAGSVAGLLLVLAAAPSAANAADCVVLLHGLARTAASMVRLENALRAAGYAVSNVDYPSREHPVEVLAPLAVEQGLAACGDYDRVHFVTHSLGGILVRYYLERNDVPRLGRVVMLAPPNQGSEVVDVFRHVPGYGLLNGPAGLQLGTDADGIPAALGPVDFDVGVIAGSKTFNLVLSQVLPNPDDGKVSVARTRVEGMRDFIVVPQSHPFIMQAPAVIEQVRRYLATGTFRHE